MKPHISEPKNKERQVKGSVKVDEAISYRDLLNEVGKEDASLLKRNFGKRATK